MVLETEPTGAVTVMPAGSGVLTVSGPGNNIGVADAAAAAPAAPAAPTPTVLLSCMACSVVC